MMAIYFLFILAGLFLVSSISKLLSQADFMKTLYQLGVPSKYRKFVALFIPFIEAIVVVCLVIPRIQPFGQIVFLSTLVLFTVVTIRTITQDKKMDCNCFGSVMPDQLGWGTLIRLIVLILMAVYLIFAPPANLSIIPAMELFYQIATSAGILALYAVTMHVVRYQVLNRRMEV